MPIMGVGNSMDVQKSGHGKILEADIISAMTELLQVIKKYTIRHDRKIKAICSPLATCLNIPVFTYYFIEADGRFGYITNMPEFNEYYFSQKLYQNNPFFAHPALFRSGRTLLPCTYDDEVQSTLNKRFQANHFFLTLQTNGAKMEGFIFAEENVGPGGAARYLPHLELFDQFGRYFKKEAKDIIGRMQAEKYNIRDARGADAFETPTPVPLTDRNPNVQAFLKRISGLTRQEQRCLDYFRQGKSAQATGALMGISQRTVEYYFENIKAKLGCHSKYDLLSS